uniref:Sulfurtransferase n=1 Tax=Syphacia muris TaxID=451379 RepID=A0A0N5AMU4_9BILA
MIFQRRRANCSIFVLSTLLAIVSLLFEQRRRTDAEVSASYLLTLLITQRKVCLLEAGTDRTESSRAAYLNEHIEFAQLFYYQNISDNGAPIHPLQFQQFMRTLGIDSDCYVIIYDRGEVIWATYGYWMFTLFGHDKVSILSGGFERWKMLQRTSAQYRTVNGVGQFVQRSGNFQAKWNQNVICTFDDVITNSELQTYTLVDAQNAEEYNGTGKGAIFGHIKSAINVPADTVYKWTEQRWLNSTELQKLFSQNGIQRSKAVIVYCSTSVRASMIWFALQKADYSAMIYYGSWPEWLIKAPDYLKITSVI